MKALGHILMAQKVVGEKVLAAAGALLPELVPYLLRDIFEYEEFHEGGKTLFDFLKAEDLQNLDLALGFLTHGVTFGADGFKNARELPVDADAPDCEQPLAGRKELA